MWRQLLATASGQLELQRWTPTADACSLARTGGVIPLFRVLIPYPEVERRGTDSRDSQIPT